MRRLRILLAAAVLAVFVATPATASPVTAAYPACSVQMFTFGSGFQVFVTINNATASALNGWTVRFTLAPAIATSTAFNGILTRDATGGAITPMVWNVVIAAGGQLTTGFSGGGNTPTLVVPTDFALDGRPCTAV